MSVEVVGWLSFSSCLWDSLSSHGVVLGICGRVSSCFGIVCWARAWFGLLVGGWLRPWMGWLHARKSQRQKLVQLSTMMHPHRNRQASKSQEVPLLFVFSPTLLCAFFGLWVRHSKLQVWVGLRPSASERFCQVSNQSNAELLWALSCDLLGASEGNCKHQQASTFSSFCQDTTAKHYLSFWSEGEQPHRDREA